MADVKHECLDLALQWEDNNAACFEHLRDLQRQVWKFINRLITIHRRHNQAAAEAYLKSVGIDDPATWMQCDELLTDEQARNIESEWRERGIDLKVRRFVEIPAKFTSLGECWLNERWSFRQGAAMYEWTAQVAKVLGYSTLGIAEFAKMADEFYAVALSIETAGDALDIINAIDGRPFDREQAWLSAELIDLSHPDAGRDPDLSPMLNAHSSWNNENLRLINWLIFKDDKLKKRIKPTAIGSSPRDKWIYEQCLDLKQTLGKIKDDLVAIAEEENWRTINTETGIRSAANRYAKENGLERPPNRKK